MKKLLIILIVLLGTGQRIYSQDNQPKELGIGFAIATDPYKFYDGSHYNYFFSDKELKSKWIESSIFPFFYKPDYGLYHFICLEKNDSYYKILINDSSLAYIPNDSNFYFKTWDMMLIQSTVERLTTDNQIYEKADSDSPIIQNDCTLDRLKVEDIIEKNGQYWAFISFSSECEIYPENGPNIKYGWIIWRVKNKLLVDILLLC